MSIVASLTALLKLDTKGFSTGVNSAIKSVGRLNRKMTFASRDIATAGASITALSAPFALFGIQSVKAAARAEENANKIKVVFSDMQKAAGESIRKFADDFDLAQSEAVKLVSTTGDLLTGFGFSQKEALKLSVAVNELAGDLTSFNTDIDNVGDASERLTKGLLGQTKGMLGLKIAIRQDTAAFQGLVQEIMQQTGLTLQAAKAMAIFKEAVKQSKNAIGDYARTSDSFINTLRRISQRIIDLRIEVGKFLIEGLDLGAVLIKIADGVTKVITFIRALSPALKKLIARILLGVTVMGPLLLILGTIGLAISGIVSGALALASALASLFSPVGLLLTAIVALGAALVKTFDLDLKKLGMKTLGFILNIKTNFTILANFLKQLFKNVWENLPAILDKVWKNVLFNTKAAFERLGIVASTSFMWIKENWGIMLDGMMGKLISFIIKAAIKIGSFASSIIDFQLALAKGSFGLAKEIAAGLLTGIAKGMLFPKVQDSYKKSIKEALEGATGFKSFVSGLEDLIPLFPGFLTDINSGLAELKDTVGGGPGGGGPGAPGVLGAAGGTVSELAKGSVEAFRIRANAQLKPAIETANNTSEINENVERMIDVGVPINNINTFSIQTA